jgi:hypothetical protein
MTNELRKTYASLADYLERRAAVREANGDIEGAAKFRKSAATYRGLVK